MKYILSFTSMSVTALHYLTFSSKTIYRKTLANISIPPPLPRQLYSLRSSCTLKMAGEVKRSTELMEYATRWRYLTVVTSCSTRGHLMSWSRLLVEGSEPVELTRWCCCLWSCHHEEIRACRVAIRTSSICWVQYTWHQWDKLTTLEIIKRTKLTENRGIHG